jgi:predicted secreted protein
MKRFFLFSVSCATLTFAVFNSVALADVFKSYRRLSGFSPDSRYYIYLESSKNSVNDLTTAHIQIINLATNSCQPDGCLKTEANDAANTTFRAAEDDLLKKTLSLRQNLNLTNLKEGIRLPMISRSSKSDGSETVQFKVNNPKEPLQILLQQRSIASIASPRGSSDVDRAAMRLVINYKNRRLTLGDLNNYREAVKRYSIREVRLSPNKRNVIVLIDQTQPTYEGVVLTTFVQSFAI